MSETPLPGAGRRRRWLIGGLIASLALNAFLIGAVATDLLRIPGWGKGGSRSFNFELRWLKGRLPDDGMARVEAAVTAVRPDAERRFDRLKELRRELGVLAAAPSPDRAAIDARLTDIRAEMNEMLTEIQRTSVDALLALPPDMRARLAEDDPPKP